MSAVYVLHFDPPFQHAAHYIGFTEHEDVATRLGEHVSGRGSPLVKAAVRAGSRVEIAHVFVNGTRTFDRSLKNRADVCRWCRCCGRNEYRAPRMKK
jgi:predicted GIY-YIG superfamily endonuclease